MSELDSPLPAENTMYVLDPDGKPVRPKTLREWGEFMESGKRKVARDKISDDVEVSTVFLGMDHSFGSGPPVLWETMVFGGPLDQEEERYTCRRAAELGHAEMVARCKKALEEQKP